MDSKELNVKYQEQTARKEQLGRYTAQEAATIISNATGERHETILDHLKDAVESGSLIAYGPGEDAPYKSPIFRDFYEEFYWDDLNNWLEKKLRRLDFKFQQGEKPIVRARNVRTENTVQRNKDIKDFYEKLYVAGSKRQKHWAMTKQPLPFTKEDFMAVFWDKHPHYTKRKILTMQDVLKKLRLTFHRGTRSGKKEEIHGLISS